MSSFSLHIATDNAAFGDQPAGALAQMLRELAHKLDRGTAELDPTDHRHGANIGTVRDSNGNTCGRWFWTDRTASHDDTAALEAITTELDQGASVGSVDTDRMREWIRYTGREVRA